MQAGSGDVVAIAHTSLGGVSRGHTMTSIIKQKILQQVIGFLPREGLVRLVRGQLLLDRIEQTSVDDRRLFSRQNFAFVSDLTNEEPIAKEMRECPSTKGNASSCFAGCKRPRPGMDFPCFKITRQFIDSADLEISAKDQSNPFGLLLHNKELAVLQLVAKGVGDLQPKAPCVWKLKSCHGSVRR